MRAAAPWRSSAFRVLAASTLAIGMVQLADGRAVASEVWSPARRITTADSTASGLLSDGTSVTLRLRSAKWTDRSGTRHVGTVLTQYRRPGGGDWSGPRRVRRWSGIVGCRWVGAAEGATVAAAVWCRADRPRVRFARALVWTRQSGWRGHRVVNARLGLDQAPNGNVILTGSRGGTAHLLTYNRVSGRWHEYQHGRPSGATATVGAIDNGGRLLLAHVVKTDAGQRLVVERHSGDGWRRRKVLDRVPQRLTLEGVDLNGRGDGVVAWVTRTGSRAGYTAEVLRAAVTVGGRWAGVEAADLDHGTDQLRFARAGVDRAGEVTVVWQRGPGADSNTAAAVLSRQRSSGGAWTPTEVLAQESSLTGFDLNPSGGAVLAYCASFGCGDSPSEFVRLRFDGESGWATPEQVGRPGATAAMASDGTTTLWWRVDEPQNTVPGLYSSTADAVQQTPR